MSNEGNLPLVVRPLVPVDAIPHLRTLLRQALGRPLALQAALANIAHLRRLALLADGLSFCVASLVLLVVPQANLEDDATETFAHRPGAGMTLSGTRVPARSTSISTS